jgi:hypothetical protein
MGLYQRSTGKRLRPRWSRPAPDDEVRVQGVFEVVQPAP